MSLRAMTRRVATAPLLAVIFVYRRAISPFLAPRCRYHPTCSAYAAQALRERGLIAGTWLAIFRIVRCNPWSLGGVDHVPASGWRPLPRAGEGKRSHTDHEEPLES